MTDALHDLNALLHECADELADINADELDVTDSYAEVA